MTNLSDDMDDRARKSLKLFYALWPDENSRASIAGLQRTVQGRQTSYENLHLTLAFLGQQPAALLPALKKIMTDLPASQMTLALDRVGYFTRHRIAWAGMHEVPEALNTLYADLVQTLKRQHIVFDSEPDFRPHLTLARDAPAPSELEFEPIVWRADCIALVQSVTNPDGVCYRVLASRRLDSGEKTAS
jgi:2'-5' RNA ligase